MTGIAHQKLEDPTVTFHLQDRHLNDPIRLVRETATEFRCKVSEIHLQNHQLFERHSVILSQKDCEALSDTLKEAGWSDFFKANALFLVENEFPKTFPADQNKGRKRDIAQAIRILTQLSEERQFLPAINSLAICYCFGVGVVKDFAQMIQLLQKAADQNFPISVRNLGWCYREGVGFKKNYQLALQSFERAAQLGLMMVYADIAYIYETATTPNMQKSVSYYEFAAKNGVLKAQIRLKELKQSQPAIAPQPSPPVQPEAQNGMNFQAIFNLMPRMQALEGQVKQLTQQLAQKDLQIAEMQKQMREQAESHHQEMKDMLALILQKMDVKESAGD